MRIRRLIALAAACAIVQGCALSNATLGVQTDPAQLSAGPLSEAGNQVFVIGDLEDVRPDRARVGAKKNGFGMETADIMTDRPVTEILQEAIASGLVANGHSVGTEGVAVTGAVKQFWAYHDTNFSNIEIICNIETDLTFTDTATDDVIHHALYSASFSDKFQTAMEKNYQAVISGAVRALVEELVFDEDLVEALGAVRASTAHRD